MYPGQETYDEDESDRWDNLALRKARGKGNPKKKRSADGEFLLGVVVWVVVMMEANAHAESKRFAKKKPVAAAKAAPAS